jgi:hypothetical protein
MAQSALWIAARRSGARFCGRPDFRRADSTCGVREIIVMSKRRRVVIIDSAREWSQSFRVRSAPLPSVLRSVNATSAGGCSSMEPPGIETGPAMMRGHDPAAAVPGNV